MVVQKQWLMIVNSRALGFKTWHMQLSMIFNRQKSHFKGLDQLLLRITLLYLTILVVCSGWESFSWNKEWFLIKRDKPRLTIKTLVLLNYIFLIVHSFLIYLIFDLNLSATGGEHLVQAPPPVGFLTAVL